MKIDSKKLLPGSGGSLSIIAVKSNKITALSTENKPVDFNKFIANVEGVKKEKRRRKPYNSEFKILKSELIGIRNILKKTLKSNELYYDRKKRLEEKTARKQKEEEIEEKPKLGKKGGALAKKLFPSSNIFEGIKKFIGNIILGKFVLFLLENYDRFLKLVDYIAPVTTMITDFAGKLFNGVVNLIDGIYTKKDEIEKKLEEFGGQGAKDDFNKFTKTLTRMLNLGLMLAMAGVPYDIPLGPDKKPTKPTKPTKPSTKPTSKAVRKRYERRYGKDAARNRFKGKVRPKPTKPFTQVPSVRPRPTAPKVRPSNLKKLLKFKKQLKMVKGKIPIMGPLIIGIDTYFEDVEPKPDGDGIPDKKLDKALFKAGGSLLGGFLGSFIPIPVLGTLLGTFLGEYVGDLFYELIRGGGISGVGQKLKKDFKKLLDTGKVVGAWIKDGLTRFFQGIPKINLFGLKAPDPRWLINPLNVVDKIKLFNKAFFSRDPMVETPEQKKKRLKREAEEAKKKQEASDQDYTYSDYGDDGEDELTIAERVGTGDSRDNIPSPPALSGGLLDGAKSIIGMGKGVGDQCANTTRAALKAAGHPAANKVTQVGDLDTPKGTAYNAPSFAASFGGSDMGQVITNKAQIRAGDIILWRADRDLGGALNKGAITHVGIAADDGLNYQFDHNRSKGFHYRRHWHSSGGTSWFAGIRLGASGGGKPVKLPSQSTNTQGSGDARDSLKPSSDAEQSSGDSFQNKFMKAIGLLPSSPAPSVSSDEETIASRSSKSSASIAPSASSINSDILKVKASYEEGTSQLVLIQPVHIEKEVEMENPYNFTFPQL